MVNRGYREFIVDLQNCVMMDSTFMGTLAGVALRLKELGNGHLHVVHCGGRSRELLSGLGLDQIFDIHSGGVAGPTCSDLDGDEAPTASSEQKRQQAQTMLDAHEALCEAAPENFTRFKDVLDYLKQDLHQKSATK